MSGQKVLFFVAGVAGAILLSRVLVPDIALNRVVLYHACLAKTVGRVHPVYSVHSAAVVPKGVLT